MSRRHIKTDPPVELESLQDPDSASLPRSDAATWLGVAGSAGPPGNANAPPAAVAVVDLQGRVRAADQTLRNWLASLLPRAAQQIVSDPPPMLGKLLSDAPAGQWVREAILHRVSLSFEVALAVEPPTPMILRITPLDGLDGPLALASLYHAAQSEPAMGLDAVTELPGRRAIADCVHRWRHKLAGAAARFAVLFVDLDGFKHINDSFGHAAGDRVLRIIADRLRDGVRDGDLVARYGGDEFVILLHDICTADAIEHVTRRLRESVAAPIEADEEPFVVKATIGVALATSNEQSIEDLVATADQDMYSRKTRRRPR